MCVHKRKMCVRKPEIKLVHGGIPLQKETPLYRLTTRHRGHCNPASFSSVVTSELEMQTLILDFECIQSE